MELQTQVYVGFSVLFLFVVMLFLRSNSHCSRISKNNRKIRDTITRQDKYTSFIDEDIEDFKKSLEDATKYLKFNRGVESFAIPRNIMFKLEDRNLNTFSNEDRQIEYSIELEEETKFKKLFEGGEGAGKIDEMSSGDIKKLLKQIENSDITNLYPDYDKSILDLRGKKYSSLGINITQKPAGGALLIFDNDTKIEDRFAIFMGKYDIINYGLQEVAFIEVKD